MIQPISLDVDFGASVRISRGAAVGDEKAGDLVSVEAFALPATDRRIKTIVAYVRPFNGGATGSDLRFQVFSGSGEHVALAATHEIACHWVMGEAYRFAAVELDGYHKADQRAADQRRLGRHG